MKLYHVKIHDKKTSEILHDEKERSLTKKSLQSKYNAKFRFHPNVVVISIERLTRKPGVQTSILDYENE